MADGTEQVAEAATGEESDWEDELIPGHEYDGIREYDNPVPGWLSLLFVGTIVWSLFYLVAINLGYIDDYQTSLKQGRAELIQMREEARRGREKVTPQRLSEAVGTEKLVQQGETIYDKQCAQCHREDGGGDIGPNLTDEYWIHGGSLMAIYETITNGVQGKGMPPWGSKLSPQERVALVTFVQSVQGTNPPDAKKPEGEKYTPDEEK